MARINQWTMSPAEKLVLGVSLDGEIDADVTLSAPNVTLWTKSGDVYTQVESGFTVSGEAANIEALTTESGETIAIGRGVVFTLTAPSTAGTYYVRVDATGSDTTAPSTERTLIVRGAPAPA